MRVVSSRPVWYEKTLFHREISAQEQETIIHLINDPGKPYVDYTQIDAPPVQQNLEVTVKVPAGMKLRQAWSLGPDAGGAARELPAVAAEAGWIKVTLPQLAIWDVLVLSWGRE